MISKLAKYECRTRVSIYRLNVLMCTNIAGGCVSRARGARLWRSGSERVSRERLALALAVRAAAAFVRASRLPVAMTSPSLCLYLLLPHSSICANVRAAGRPNVLILLRNYNTVQHIFPHAVQSVSCPVHVFFSVSSRLDSSRFDCLCLSSVRVCALRLDDTFSCSQCPLALRLVSS